MLKRLQNRLHLFLIVLFMAIISLILCFAFLNTWQIRHTTDVAYLQRMASLIIYQLEADPEDPASLLSNYENEMHVYSILEDESGKILFQSNPDTSTKLSTLWETAMESSAAQTPSGTSPAPKITEQGGYVEITGEHHDRYSVIPAIVRTKSGRSYSLALFYEQLSPIGLLARQAPAYLGIWISSLVFLFFVSRFLLGKAFEPTERVLESQKEFVASASHELKSPLAVILANTENLQNFAPLDQRIQNHLQVIDSECMRMSRLVRDMLLLAASDADKWTIQKQEVNVDTLLINLYEAYEPICQKHSLSLKLDLGEDCFLPLITDQERLFQILSIFLDNAVSYSPAGSAVELKVKETSRELTFLVADHGKGIAKEDQPYIFDRFYRADKSHTDKSHFGLGLSIARELARILGGKIGFEDTEGGGVTFFLTLPISRRSNSA